jgi:hypothetical protein
MIIYYINLDHRVDRRQQIEAEMEGAFLPVERVPAVHEPEFGILGCGRSHARCLERFLETEHEACFIFEDDFQFIRPKCELCLPDEPWDVIMLSGSIVRALPHHHEYDRVIEAQTASGYAVHRDFARSLMANVTEGIDLLSRTRNAPDFAVDMYWKTLQPLSKWFVYCPKFGIQRPGYSDIEGMDVDYGV